MEKKEVVLFSHDDLDGGSPKFIAKAVFGNQLTYYRLCGYHNINESILKFINSENHSLEQIIFITDIGINDDVAAELQKLHEQGQEICLLDHHITNVHLNEYDWAKVIPEQNGKKESGTSLFYHYLVSEGFVKPNIFLLSYAETVRSYDTWDWEKNGDMLAHDLNMLYFLISPKEMEKIVIEGYQQDEPFTSLPERFNLLLDTERDRIHRYCNSKLKTIRFIELFGRKTAVTYLDQYFSYVADAIQEAYPETDVICMIDVARNKVSLRSRKDDIEVVDIAQYFGGGGHPKAAGFDIPIEYFNDFVFHSKKKDITGNIEQ